MKEKSPFLKLVEKYGHDCQFFSKYGKDMSLLVLFYRRGDDYLLVTSEGEEYPLKLETLDKVRDICCGNLRSLTDYEFKVLEKFSDEWLLEQFSEESMKRFIEKETGHKISGVDLMLANSIFNLYFNPGGIFISGDENERKQNLEIMERRIKKEFGMDIKLKSSFDALTQMLVKGVSDRSFEREKFLKRIWYKRRKDKKEKDKKG